MKIKKTIKLEGINGVTDLDFPWGPFCENIYNQPNHKPFQSAALAIKINNAKDEVELTDEESLLLMELIQVVGFSGQIAKTIESNLK